MQARLIPYKFWIRDDGKRASLRGALPWTSDQEKTRWSLVEDGFTILWPDGTSGCGHVHLDRTWEAMEACLARFPKNFPGMSQR